METTSGTGVEISDSILDAVGDTPLVRLSRLGKDLRPQLIAKIEATKNRELNGTEPGGIPVPQIPNDVLTSSLVIKY